MAMFCAPRRRGFGLACRLLGMVSLLCASAQLEAADKFWDNTAGGNFTTSANWQSCGFFCNPVPGANDVAHFGLSDPSSIFTFFYTVTFANNPTTNSLLIEDDVVTFDLNGHTYTNSHSPFMIATQIGNQSGRGGSLNVTDGLYDINSGVFVGIAGGSGVLRISSGGSVQSEIFARIGASGSSGTVNVIGASSQWTHAGEMSIGWGGTGTMNITGGGLVQNGTGLIADGFSPGTVTVSGTNSRWINSDLFVGNGGNATLNITSSGFVQSTSGHVAFVAGHTGAVTVDAARWFNSGDLFLGDLGSGTMNVTGGGLVQNDNAAIGAAPGSDGAVTVASSTNIASNWVNSGELNVGHSGAGTLEILTAGAVFNTNAYIGRFAGSTGVVNVNGPDATWHNLGNLTVGNDGDGQLNITPGSVVENVDGTIGAGSGSTGRVVLDGVNSHWFNTGTLTVGSFSSNATLDILNGGRVQSDEDATIGYGGSGSVTVDGAGSRWDAAGLLVSLTGMATLDITDGGVVSSTNGGVGGKSSGVGVVHVDGAGSQWLNSGGLSVGIFGTGTLDITSGGVVQSAAGRIGTAGPGEGVVNVTGSGSRWTNTGSLTIGEDGIGTLNITGGAVVENTEGRVGASVSSSGSGEVNVDGPGSQWINSSLLTISDGVDGILNITNGGVVVSNAALTSEDDAYLGLSADATGIVTVSGPGSMWTHHGRFHVGNNGTSVLMIEDGGVVAVSGDGRIGVENGPLSTVTVTGPGSSWLIDGELAVSDGGIGELAITAGGAVSSADTQIAKENASVGAATIAGAGSTWTINGQLGVGGIVDILLSGGTGTLSIQSGGTVNVTQNTVIFDEGLLRLEGGTLDTQAISFEAGGEFDWTSGTLHVGTFSGDLLNQGGMLAPGHSAGTTTISGSYAQQSAGKLEIEIGGTAPGSTHDVVNITGFAGLGGQLQLALLDSFFPSSSDTFTVLSATIGIFGSFSNVANGQRLPVLDGLGSFLVHYGPGSAFDPNEVVLAAFEPAGLPGDFNLDGIVDTADFVMWQKGLGSTFTQNGFNIWRTNFGATTGSGAVLSQPSQATIPEPASLLLTFLALAALAIPSRFIVDRM